MEVRPNSHPENTGHAMTGTLSDGTVVDAAFVDGILGVMSVLICAVKVARFG